MYAIIYNTYLRETQTSLNHGLAHGVSVYVEELEGRNQAENVIELVKREGKYLKINLFAAPTLIIFILAKRASSELEVN